MILTMENICKSYYRGKNEVPVLHDVCLTVAKAMLPRSVASFAQFSYLLSKGEM